MGGSSTHIQCHRTNENHQQARLVGDPHVHTYHQPADVSRNLG